jgi:hypothetical protein
LRAHRDAPRLSLGESVYGQVCSSLGYGIER